MVLKPHLKPNDGVVPLFSAGPLNLRGLPASGMVLKPLIGTVVPVFFSVHGGMIQPAPRAGWTVANSLAISIKRPAY